MKMKRSIALLIALAMSINMFGVTAFAQDTPAETGATGAQITGQSDGQPGEGTTPAGTPADETGGETTPASTPADEGGEGTTPAGTPAGEGDEGTTPASTPADETGGETTPASTPADEGDEGTTPASTPADEDGEGTPPKTEADGNPAPAPLSEAQQAFVDAVNALDKEALLALAEAYMANPNAETGDTMDEAYLGITDAEALFAALTADEQGEETVAAANTALQEIKTEVDAALAAEPMLLSTVTGVKYLDAFGEEQTADSCTVMASGSTTWNAGWYVVNSDVTISGRVTVKGAANLILADDCTLTAQGITVNGTASLTIYGQSDGTGKLTSVSNSDFCAGIGGYRINDVGDITINGGVIDATGYTGCAGIGGSKNSTSDRGSVGTITINGGTVTATGSTSGAGIGSAEAQAGGTIIINGGTVTASGATNADSCGAGIGTGAYAKSAGTITINGGTVTATGGSGIINGAMGGAGIGAGANANSAGTITINGGTVTATSNLDNAAAIGAGQASQGGSYNITISGGTVTANKAGGTGDGTIGKVDTGSATVTFTTTDTGNALINAGAITDTSNQSTWHGIIYNTATTGKVYGNQTVANVTLPAKTLTIPTGTTLAVDAVTLPTGGTITNEGTISLSDSDTLTNSGTIQYLVTATGDDQVSEIKTSSDGSTYTDYTADSKTYGTSGTPLYIQATLSSGYTLNQWTVTGTGLSTTSTDNPYVIATTNLNPVTLAATSKVSAYKITYKDQDNQDFTGTNIEALPTTYTPGTQTTLVNATKTGYTFGGWYTASNCDGTALTTLDANGYNADITLYAKWTKTAAAPPTLTGNNPAAQTYGSISDTMTVGISDKDDASYTYTYQWYTGTYPSPEIIQGATSASYAIPTGLTAATNPYKYTVKVTATRNDNAEAATAEKIFSVTVNKATVAVPTIPDKTYNGKPQTSGLTDTDDYTVDRDSGYTSAINSPYPVGLSLKDSTNKKWATSEKTAITVNYNINPKPLTPRLTGTTTKEYDGTTTSDGSGLSIALAGIEGYDSLTATAGSYTYDDANVGTGKTITASGITLSGSSAGNYTLSATSVTGTVGSITRKPITVTADDKSKTYGEADPAWTYTVSTSTPLVGTDSLTGTLTRAAGENYNTYGYAITQGTLTNGNNPNYDITFTNGTLTINKRTAVISWDATTTFTYNGYFHAPTATVTNLLQGDSCTVYVDGGEKNVGSYTATINSLSNNNYALPADRPTQTFSITKASLTVTAKPKTITYGDAPANDGVTYTGFADEEDASWLGGTLGYDYSYTQYGNVGTYEITPKGRTSDNYDITFVKGALTVGKRPITVTAADKTSAYGAAVVPLTATVTTGSVVHDDTAYTLGTTATNTANVGNYFITVTANNDNYRVTPVNGIYTITPAKVTALDLSSLVTAPVKNAAPVTTEINQPQYTGTVSWNGNPAKFLGGTAYTATVTLTRTANYTFTGVAANAFSYTGATVTNAADSGTVTIAFPATAAHALSGIALNTAPTKTTYTYGEAFAPTGLVLDLTYDDGTTGTVTYSDTNKNDFAFTPAALTVATTSVGVTYGGKNADITGITVNKATVAAPAIPAKTYNGSNQTATVAASDDYSVTTNAGGTDVGGYKVVLTLKDPANKKWADSDAADKILTFAITPAPLTWDVSDLTAKKPYDGTTTATVTGTLKLSGVVAGDDVGLSYKELTDNTPLTGSYADKEIGTGKTVTVTVTDTVLTGAKIGNYTLPNGDIKITNGQIAAPLPIQPAQPQAPGEQLKLTVEDGIPMVPAALQSKPTLNTPAKIESALKAEAAKALPAVPAANIITMDIELWYSNNGGVNWTEATQDKFPTAGVTVVVPYTELSLTYAAAQGMEFTVLHMISAGADAGRIEYPAYTLTQDGVRFTVHSLSPITIAYKPKAAAPADNANDNGGETTAATPAPAADAAPGKFTVNAWVNTLAGGTASPMGNTTYTQGKNVTYTITPAAGYRIAKVTVDGVNVGAVSSYTFNYLNRNHEIGAYFEKTTGKAGTGSIIPQTADGAPLVLWFALLALAAIGLCVLVLRRRKKQ